MNIVQERRIGRFEFDDNEIEEHTEDALAVMGQVVVIRAEHNFVSRGIEYYGYSKLFEPLEPGKEIPQYIFEIGRNWMGEITGVRAHKV